MERRLAASKKVVYLGEVKRGPLKPTADVDTGYVHTDFLRKEYHAVLVWNLDAVLSARIELASPPSEGGILSVERREQTRSGAKTRFHAVRVPLSYEPLKGDVIRERARRNIKMLAF